MPALLIAFGRAQFYTLADLGLARTPLPDGKLADVTGQVCLGIGGWLALHCNAGKLLLTDGEQTFPFDSRLTLHLESLCEHERLLTATSRQDAEQMQLRYRIDKEALGDQFYFYADEELVDFGAWLLSVWHSEARREQLKAAWGSRRAAPI